VVLFASAFFEVAFVAVAFFVSAFFAYFFCAVPTDDIIRTEIRRANAMGRRAKRLCVKRDFMLYLGASGFCFC